MVIEPGQPPQGVRFRVVHEAVLRFSPPPPHILREAKKRLETAARHVEMLS